MNSTARWWSAVRADLPVREQLLSARRCVGSVVNLRRERAEAARQPGTPVTAHVVTIIPTYRRPGLLARAVRSALAQPETDHAVLVVSDGVPVDADLPDDPRLHVIVLSENIGIAGIVRNVGIRCSRSTYIAFLDDDNEWQPGHLGSLLAALDSGADLAYTGLIRFLPDGREFDRVFVEFDRPRLRRENYIDVNTVGVRRTSAPMFSRRRRHPTEAPGEDWVYAWRMTRHAGVVSIPDHSVRYLINPDSYFWPGFTEAADRRLREASGNPDGDADVLDVVRDG